MSQLHNTSINSDTMSHSEESTRLVGSLVDSMELAREARTSHAYGTLDSSSSESYKSERPSSILTLDDFDQFPVYANCPTCQKTVLTHIQYKAGFITWLISGILLLLGCWLGCFLIPFCLNMCKDVKHVCPDCRTELGLYKRTIG